MILGSINPPSRTQFGMFVSLLWPKQKIGSNFHPPTKNLTRPKQSGAPNTNFHMRSVHLIARSFQLRNQNAMVTNTCAVKAMQLIVFNLNSYKCFLHFDELQLLFPNRIFDLGIFVHLFYLQRHERRFTTINDGCWRDGDNL